jgi:opacity protein-like surface antigen
MVSTRLKISTLAAIALLAGGTAHGADYSQPLPQQPIIIQQPPVQEFASNWYLRGFVGAGMNANYNLDYIVNPAHSTGFVFDQHSIGDTFFVGTGIGYEWNNWLRFDVTGEYRGKTQVNARGVYDVVTGFGDAYQGYLQSLVFLANAYVDLGTWNCFTPFVGFGLGTARVKLADFTDMGVGTTGAGFGRNPSQWNFAWALYAGVAYEVTTNLKIDLSYRYLNYGSITDTVDCIGGCIPDSYKFSNLYSHDFMLGLRWTCCESAPPPPRYVYTPPPPIYTPPPPPLSSKG